VANSHPFSGNGGVFGETDPAICFIGVLRKIF
jgi:hypothetical protein